MVHVLLGTDLEKAESLIDLTSVEPSWWGWVNGEMVPSCVEERSSIDNENYVVVSEESVVDGIANFMAKCVLSNPNAQVPSRNMFAFLHSKM